MFPISVSDKPMKMGEKVDYFWLPFAQILDYNGNFKGGLCNFEERCISELNNLNLHNTNCNRYNFIKLVYYQNNN